MVGFMRSVWQIVLCGVSEGDGEGTTVAASDQAGGSVGDRRGQPRYFRRPSQYAQLEGVQPHGYVDAGTGQELRRPGPDCQHNRPGADVALVGDDARDPVSAHAKRPGPSSEQRPD